MRLPRLASFDDEPEGNDHLLLDDLTKKPPANAVNRILDAGWNRKEIMIMWGLYLQIFAKGNDTTTPPQVGFLPVRQDAANTEKILLEGITDHFVHFGPKLLRFSRATNKLVVAQYYLSRIGKRLAEIQHYGGPQGMREGLKMISKSIGRLHGLAQCACQYLQGNDLRDFFTEVGCVADQLHVAQNKLIKEISAAERNRDVEDAWAAATDAHRKAQNEVARILAAVEMGDSYKGKGSGKVN